MPVPVGPLGMERVENVRHRQNARKAGKLLRTPAAPVAGPIQFFVMGGGILAEPVESGNFFEDFERVIRMGLDGGPFLIRQLAGFLQDRVGNAQFADVVQQRGPAELLQALGAHAKPLPDFHGCVRDAAGMAIGKWRFGVDDFCKRRADLVDRVFSGRYPAVFRFKRCNLPNQVFCRPGHPIALRNLPGKRPPSPARDQTSGRCASARPPARRWVPSL